MNIKLRNVFSRRNRILVKELVATDFKLRYQGSALGYAWSLLRPLFLFAILYVVFVGFLKIGGDIPHYPIYLLLGVMMWTFFSDLTAQSLGSIVGRGDLIRKISIPRWIIVFSSSVMALINLGLNLIVLAVFMVVNGVPLQLDILLLPLLILELYIFGLGLALFLSAAFVKFRDLGYVWEIVIQAGFYLTPVLYPLSIIKDVTLQKLILLNPVAQVIQDSRAVVVSQDTITTWKVFDGGPYVFIPIIIVIVFTAIGVIYFRSQQNSFAENL